MQCTRIQKSLPIGGSYAYALPKTVVTISRTSLSFHNENRDLGKAIAECATADGR